jgi:SAM-dependent methyltransferase
MRLEHYQEFFSRRFELTVDRESHGDIIEGMLIARDGGQRHPIVGSIPRFVPAENYAANFGLQWNKFRTTQLDSHSGIHYSFNNFWNNTGWKPRDIFGKTVLEVGSGAGRFTEILLEAGARVVSFDYSSAVEANRSNNSRKGELLLFQGDVYAIPLDDASFDFVFCYGVLQHTPDPCKAFEAIFAKLKHGGRLSIDYYRKLPYPAWYSTPKYLWRPLSTTMAPDKLFKLVSWYVPLWLPVDTLLKNMLFRIPKIGQSIAGLIPIPCWNPIRMGLNGDQRREWAILNTYDALGAKYDQPKTLPEVEAMVSGPGRDLRVSLGANGVVANVTRR